MLFRLELWVNVHIENVLVIEMEQNVSWEDNI